MIAAQPYSSTSKLADQNVNRKIDNTTETTKSIQFVENQNSATFLHTPSSQSASFAENKSKFEIMNLYKPRKMDLHMIHMNN